MKSSKHRKMFLESKRRHREQQKTVAEAKREKTTLAKRRRRNKFHSKDPPQPATHPSELIQDNPQDSSSGDDNLVDSTAAKIWKLPQAEQWYWKRIPNPTIKLISWEPGEEELDQTTLEYLNDDKDSQILQSQEETDNISAQQAKQQAQTPDIPPALERTHS